MKERAARIGRAIGRKLGVDVFVLRDDFHYVPVTFGEKHEKLIDIREIGGFGELAAEVIGHGKTYLGYARLHALWQAASQVGAAGDYAEIGVFQGGSSYFLGRAAEQFAPGRTLFAFDTFSHFPAVLPVDVPATRQGQLDTSVERVSEYLSPLSNVEIRAGEFPSSAGGLEDRRFALVHVDSDTYSSYQAAFDFFAPRLVPGGVFILDDYAFTTAPGARVATDEFFAANSDDYRLFHLQTGQALLVHIAG